MLKINEEIQLQESIKIIRKLSKKQFNAIVKKGKIAAYMMQMQQRHAAGYKWLFYPIQ